MFSTIRQYAENKSFGSSILHVVLWCLTFVKTYMQISQRAVKLKSRHKYMKEFTVYNVQRAVSQKVRKQELSFLCSARPLMVLFSCVKFHKHLELFSNYKVDTSI